MTEYHENDASNADPTEGIPNPNFQENDYIEVTFEQYVEKKIDDVAETPTVAKQ